MQLISVVQMKCIMASPSRIARGFSWSNPHRVELNGSSQVRSLEKNPGTQRSLIGCPPHSLARYPMVTRQLHDSYKPHHPITEILNYKICKNYSNLAFHILTVTRRLFDNPQQLSNSYPTIMNHITRQLTTSITKFAKIIQISLSTS
jgi:hypothetical protein